MSRKGLNSADEMTLCVGLDEVTACTCLKQFLDESFIVMHGEDEHFRVRMYGAYLPGHLHAVDERQRVVDHGDIWFGLQRLLNCLLPVSGLSHHLPVRLSLNDMAQSRSDHIVVVCDQDSDHRGNSRRALTT